jgi:hypothetical protein
VPEDSFAILHHGFEIDHNGVLVINHADDTCDWVVVPCCGGLQEARASLASAQLEGGLAVGTAVVVQFPAPAGKPRSPRPGSGLYQRTPIADSRPPFE